MDFDALLAELGERVAGLYADLVAENITLEAWRAEMARLLSRYQQAAFMIGKGDTAATVLDDEILQDYLAQQLEYLDNFTNTMRGGLLPGGARRAMMYASSIKAPYWFGLAGELPLPAYPGDATTQCLTNCRCYWRIETLDEGAGDYDCYWEMSPAEHCQTCIIRARDWYPLRIRGFSVQLEPGEIADTIDIMGGLTQPVKVTLEKETRAEILATIEVFGETATLTAQGWQASDSVKKILDYETEANMPAYAPAWWAWAADYVTKKYHGKVIDVVDPGPGVPGRVN